jgi:hypothetical protein
MAYVVTPRAILSFPNLFTPKPKTDAPGAKAVYSCSLLFDAAARKTPEWKALQQAYVDAARAKWGPAIDLKSLAEFPFRDGALKEYAGYGPGIIYISASSEYEPGVVDGRLQKIIDPKLVYAGAIVLAGLSPYAWTFSGKKGVSFGLNGIQIVDSTAPRIDGRVPAEKMFSPLEELGELEEESDIPF